MKPLQRIELLSMLDITRTGFITVQIPASAVVRGIPIGIGACQAVVLQLNRLARNTQTNTAIPANQAVIYYGDRNSQEFELSGVTAGTQPRSELIFCKDLSEVYVRGNGIGNVVQVLIYY